ncbi:MAG: DNA repair and recombination protein RadB [Halobacteriales archaeon]|nr:DNA repair and recombination protein RadB [Halobacteriales archaeon]
MAPLRLLRPAQPAQPHARIPIGPPLDALLGGGLEGGGLTEVHGEAGAGKTNLALQAVCSVARAGGRTLYLDTEGLSLERLAQLAGPDLPHVQQRLLVWPVHEPSDQPGAVARAARVAKATPDVRLVVLDSATLLYRVQLAEGDGIQHRRALLRQLHSLHSVARQRGIAVLLTNQVFSDGDDGVQGLGGHAMRHLAGTVLRLERGSAPGERRATLRKHRARAEGQTVALRLGPSGFEPAGSDEGPSKAELHADAKMHL